MNIELFARVGLVAATVAVVAMMPVDQASAQNVQTLPEILARAYDTSPSLAAARAGLRATDENLPDAQSNLFRPTITLSAQEGRTLIRQRETLEAAAGTADSKKTTNSLDRTYGYSLTLPLFRGGQTFAEIDEAKSAIAAGQADLVSTEQTLLAAAVTAYADVAYYRALVKLEQTTAATYEQRVSRTSEELKAQRRTVSDLALFRSSLASARNSLATADGERRAAESSFQAISGVQPGTLEPRPAFGILPTSLEEALKNAKSNNPSLRSAEHSIAENEAAVRAKEGVLFPQLSLVQSYTREQDKSRFTGVATPYDEIDREDTITVGVTMTMPLYAGGANHAAVRASKQTLSQSRLTLASTQLTTENSVRTSWERLVAAREALKFADDNVAALDDALEAVEFQYQRSDATGRDLINVIDERTSALTTVESAHRTVFLAESSLLQATGQMTAAALGLPVDIYDPNAHLRDVDGKLFGLGD
ncbi:MAG: TolC family protein [Rhodospirillaceae bacterium]|jgi:TolC family type I secretion outer membrane protein|nr:TolC family protein [Rhodospirillaceae bacterium]MBT3932187.1 TolC family protein [Rhodospirillaceae bacterium]MBT4773371.1 TolC family protein [Rhodospirillaceae bacterium]MBT5359971.1 TolC family protein [Rhodospirillaceae bacterium]MBT5769812.1 TolC family protein [Rhodospirillaceae bacterium]